LCLCIRLGIQVVDQRIEILERSQMLPARDGRDRRVRVPYD